MISGESQFQRRAGSSLPGWGWMSTCSPLARSKRMRFPYWDSA